MPSPMDQYFKLLDKSTTKMPRRLLLAVIADVKMGKTTLGLTASEVGPLAMLDYDYGLEGPVSDFLARGKQIYHCPMDIPTSMMLEKDVTLDDYRREWLKAKDAFYTALTDPRIASILIDTGSEAWEACRLSFFGKLDKVFPINRYGEPNGEFRKLFRDVLAHPTKNLIVTLKTKEEYVNDVRTGRRVFAGMSDIPGLVQMVVHLWKKDKAYGLTIAECRHKRSLETTELPAVIATFPQLLDLVHGSE